MSFAMEPYLALILIGFLPSEVWRWLGILIGRGFGPSSKSPVYLRHVRPEQIPAQEHHWRNVRATPGAGTLPRPRPAGGA